MAEFYKVLKADPLGEPYTPNVPNAKPLQNYWCQFEGVEKAVSMSKQVGNSPGVGTSVYGDLMYAKSQKGTEYWKFKSQKVPEGTPRPADTPQQAAAQESLVPSASDLVPGWFIPYANMIRFIYDEMKGVEAPKEVTPVTQHEVLEEANKPELVAGEPLDPDTQATLDEIFGSPEVTPEPEEPQDV